MANVRRHWSKWQVQIRRQGRQLTRSFVSKGDADTWARMQESRFDRADLPPDPRALRNVTLGDLLRRYRDEVTPRKRSAPHERNRIGRLLRHDLSSRSLDRLSSADFKLFRDERLGSVGPQAVRHDLNLLGHVLRIRECYGRSVYTHKTHEKCADILLDKQAKIKLAQIALSAVTAGGVILTLFGSGEAGIAIGAICSTVLLVLNAYTNDYDLGELAQKHKQAANEIWLIREKYLSLLTNLRGGDVPLGDIRTHRDALLNQLHAAYSGAPSTTYSAYKEAQDALQNREDMTFSDA